MKHLRWYTIVSGSFLGTHPDLTLSLRNPNSVVSRQWQYPHVSKRRLDIVRILFMVPIYAIVSFASYLFWVREIFDSHRLILNPLPSKEPFDATASFTRLL